MPTTHAALPQPEMSRRRKISPNTTIATQMNRTQAKTMRMSQRTFRKGYDDAVISNGGSPPVVRFETPFSFLHPEHAVARLQPHHPDRMRALARTTQVALPRLSPSAGWLACPERDDVSAQLCLGAVWEPVACPSSLPGMHGDPAFTA